MKTPRTRVLIVEDSLTVRKRLVEVLSGDPDIEVLADVADGKSGIERCQALRPDVVTLDMMLPVMTGLAATEYIMAYCPTPILIVSASTNRGELFRTYEALAAGAVDVLEKPLGDEIDGNWERQLISAVKLVARIKVITHPRARLASLRSTPPVASVKTTSASDGLRCIGIGASTGGPAALADILGALPSNFSLPILLVLHIGTAFASALAEWLDGQSRIRVRHAVHGEPLPNRGTGVVLMAPPDRHLVVRDGRLWLTNDPERFSCRPSVDSLFESLALDVGNGAAACLLTGMGRDGARGLLAMRQAGGTTIAQDEETSVVFGMPGEAVRIGAAMQILPLNQVASALVTLAQR